MLALERDRCELEDSLCAACDPGRGYDVMGDLMRRLRLEGEGRVSAHDELDWLGNYIIDGLYFDDQFKGDRTPDICG